MPPKSPAPSRRPATGQRRASVARRRRRSFLQRWRANFLTGLALVAPVTLTLYLLWTFIEFVDSKIVPLVPAAYNPDTYLGFHLPGFGLLVFVVFTALVGVATKNLFGRQLVLMAEGWVERMPVVRSLYNGIKQIIETVVTQSGGASFQTACLIEYPRRGLWAIAFVSTETRGEILSKAGGGAMTSVFLPTTPNPTSGFLLFVPKEDVIVLGMSVEEAAKLVISAGLVVPPTAEEKAAGLARRGPQGQPVPSPARPGAPPPGPMAPRPAPDAPGEPKARGVGADAED
ncbi:MAG TPA: DUF502 domain-containing protein [Paracoccaceae bacterium]|nr:DUF502 domain-containing protein [Paracoccaceae bacterium]